MKEYVLPESLRVALLKHLERQPLGDVLPLFMALQNLPPVEKEST